MYCDFVIALYFEAIPAGEQIICLPFYFVKLCWLFTLRYGDEESLTIYSITLPIFFSDAVKGWSPSWPNEGLPLR